jgi:uncharacterized protein (DUF433 family)
VPPTADSFIANRVHCVFSSKNRAATIEDIIEWFGVTREQVTAVLDFAARSLEVPARR